MLKMIRTIIAASCVFSFLNVTASACDGSDCSATTKPMNILQFMRQQAASTRSAISRPLPKETKRPVVREATLRKNAVRIPAREIGVRAALRGPINSGAKKTILRSPRVVARLQHDDAPVAASSFAAREPFIQVVTSDELNAIDRAPEPVGAPLSMDQTALQVVTEAFDEIDRKHDGSLTVDDLRAASERAQATQAGYSWLQQMWRTLSGAFRPFAAN
jgi:hypothetical protein